MKVKYADSVLGFLVLFVLFYSGFCYGQMSGLETSPATSHLAPEQKASFWQQQCKGANGDTGQDLNQWFKAVSDAGIEFVRLTPAKWKAQKRDFLLGDADHFTGIPEQDLSRLKDALDAASRYNVRVVLTMFSLPGARWRQHNKGKFDYRLWTDEAYQKQALLFWKKLAAALKDHPAIVAYNPINEPYPARKDGFTDEEHRGFDEWLRKHKGTASDLNRFNRRVVAAIRTEDPYTPIILDGWFHAAAQGIPYLTPVNDNAVLYAFHFYDPWIYTTFRVNKKRFSYPDKMPVGSTGKTEVWNKANIEQRMQPVVEWAARNKIPSSRIIVEEFGGDRRVAGIQQYFEDIISVLNDKGWHWAFYSFRSSDWDGMDYELGTKKLRWKYWQEREKGVPHEQLIHRRDNPLWDVFKREFNKPHASSIID